MDHVTTKTQEDLNGVQKAASKAADLRKIPVTRETFTAFLWVSGCSLLFGGSVLVGLITRWLGVPAPVPFVATACTFGVSFFAVKHVFAMEALRAFIDALGTFEDLEYRRLRLHKIVETCAKLEEATARFTLPDQLATWGSLSTLEDGIDDLVSLRRHLWMEVRDPVVCTGPMPSPVADYIDHADRLFHETMHPKVLAASVQRFLDGFLAADTAPRWQARRLAEIGQMGFVESCPRFDIRSNIDWVLANAWCVAGHEHLAGRDVPRGDLMDGQDEAECFQAAYLSWWDLPREKRSGQLSFDRVLLCAPAVLFAVRAVGPEPKGRQYPISTGSFAVVDEVDAPVDYVKRLWESAQGARYPERMSLRRIVKAASLLNKNSKV